MINKNITAFNLRTYAIIIDNGNLLLSKELIKGKESIKFPGGGVEFGEGIIAALKREAMEEMNVELNNIQHFYTTDFFQQSAFNSKDQLISIYYTAKLSTKLKINERTQPIKDYPVFFWKKLSDIHVTDLHFPIDKHVCSLIKEIL